MELKLTETVMQADAPSSRGWFWSGARPSLLWLIILCLPYAIYSPDVSDVKLRILTGAAIALAVFRGAIDKDGLARLLAIWKGGAA